eukprot:281196_1
MNFLCKIAKTLHLLFSEPSSNKSAFIISILMTLMIIGSCLSFIFETLPAYKYPAVGNEPGDKWEYFKKFELITFRIFLSEYLIRILTCFAVEYRVILNTTKKNIDESELIKNLECQCCVRNLPTFLHKICRFFIQPFNLIDFISLIPNFLLYSVDMSVQLNGVTTLRIFRLFRVFRFLKSEKLFEVTNMFINTMKQSIVAIYMLLFLSVIVATIFGSLIYSMEEGEFVTNGCDDGTRDCYMRSKYYGNGLEESPFFSIPQAIWWAFVTISTVGYGDLYPTSNAGKFLAIIVLHVGILFLAMPITILSSNFEHIWKSFHIKKQRESKTDSGGITYQQIENTELLMQKIDELNLKVDLLIKCEKQREVKELPKDNTKIARILPKIENILRNELLQPNVDINAIIDNLRLSVSPTNDSFSSDSSSVMVNVAS